MDKAKAIYELRKNLKQASKEILTWRKTGILPNGIVNIVAKTYVDNDLTITEMFIENLALEKSAGD
jgi:hypothetical protein